MLRPVYARALALLLAAAPLASAAQDEEEESYASSPPTQQHLHLTAWGGTLVDTGSQFPAAGFAGGEIAWAFETLELGALGQAYHLGRRARTPWSPVILGRIRQRFETRRGLDATVGLGIGAGRTDHWLTWFQFAIGLRLYAGPLFITGEVGFEQLDLFRIAGGVGVRF
jgi:hypothetical protein